MTRKLLHSMMLASAFSLVAFSTALAGPPWIAIEYPANPFDRSTRDGFLTVRTYHHGDLRSRTVTGTAEGIVNGKRQTMRLDIRPASQAGMYVVRWQRPSSGKWVLVINAAEQGIVTASAVVEINPAGGIAGVTVPTHHVGDGWIGPRAVATSEVEALLQGRAIVSASGPARAAAR